MQVFWWLLFGAAVLVEAVLRGFLIHLARQARRGVPATEIIVVALAPAFGLALLLRFAGIASAFVLGASKTGTTSAVMYWIGALWSGATVVEATHALYSSWEGQ